MSRPLLPTDTDYSSAFAGGPPLPTEEGRKVEERALDVWRSTRPAPEIVGTTTNVKAAALLASDTVYPAAFAGGPPMPTEEGLRVIARALEDSKRARSINPDGAKPE